MARPLERNLSWNVSSELTTWEMVQVRLLQDIRDTLNEVSDLLHCDNAVDIPNILRDIRKNTAKPKRRKK